MIQKYIKVILSLLCLLNLGISGSSASGLTELVFERAGGETMRVLCPTGYGQQVLWPINYRGNGQNSYPVISIKLNEEDTIEVNVFPDWIECPDGKDRLVFDKPSVLDALKECGVLKLKDISTPPSGPYSECKLSYRGRTLGKEDHFFNDYPLSLTLSDTYQLDMARLSDIVARNTLEILLDGKVTKVRVKHYRVEKRGKSEVLKFHPHDIVKTLVSEGIVADRRLCRLFTRVNPLIEKALSAKNITEENIDAILLFNQKPIDLDNSRPVYNTVKPSICVYTSRLESAVKEDDERIDLSFTMSNTTKYGNFSSATGQNEFGDTIMNRLLIALVEKYGELFLLQDGNKLKLFLDNGNLKVLKEGQEIPLELHSDWELCDSEGMSGLETWLEIYMAVGDQMAPQLGLCFEQTCCKDQENLVRSVWYGNKSLIYPKDTPNGSDEVEWVTVSPEIIKKALVDIITELQSEAVANPVQSAASSSGLGFTPPARSSTPATSSAGLGFTPPARSSTPATSSAGLGFTPPARSSTPATSGAGLGFTPHARSLSF